MVPIALLLLSPTAAQTIDRAVAAHTAQTRGHARIERLLGKTKASVDLEWQRPLKAWMRYREGTTDQTVYLSGSTVTAYDGATREYITRRTTGSSLAQRMTRAIGPFEYSAQILLDPAALRAFLSPYRKRATVRTVGGTVLLTQGDVGFAFDARTHLLKRATNGGQTWNLSYLPAPGSVSFQPPKGAVHVDVFAPPVSMPQFADLQTKATIRKMVQTYRSYRAGMVTVVADESRTRIAFSGSRYLYEGAGVRWAYDGKALSYSRGGSSQSDPVKRGALLDELAYRKLPVDPTLRSFIAHQTPFQEYLGRDVKASIGGQVGVGGVLCTIVNLVRPDSRAALFVGPDGFVRSASVETLGLHGELLDTSIRRFSYTSLPPTIRFSVR